MKAALYYGAHDVRIEDVPTPVRKPGEVLLRVLRCGMCGTDATEWKAGPHTFPVPGPHPRTGHSGPMIPGHEFIGEVLEADAGGRFSAGDIVASGAGIWCGECVRCREGRTNLCLDYYTLGLNTDGGMAEFLSCPEHALVPVPAGLSLDLAGLAQPLAVGLHAARRSEVTAGETVVIIGAGAIGSFVLAGLKSLADIDLTVVDFAGPRLDRALRLGANRIVPVDDNTRAAVFDAVGPRGADRIIEASGALGQMNNAIALVRTGGTILQVGLPASEQPVDIHSLVMREITIRTTLAHVCAEDLAPALQILATTALGPELLEGVLPLASLPDQLELLAAGKLEGKVLFDPSL